MWYLLAVAMASPLDPWVGREAPPLGDEQIEALARAGEVWAFLDAHHPAVRRGEVDPHEALWAVLPEVLSRPDQVDAVLVDWVDGFGSLPAAPATPLPSDLVLAPDLRLLDGDGPLHQRLTATWAARGAGDVRVRSVDGFHTFAYPTHGDRLDPENRIMAVLRAWSTIQWWSPYRDLVDGDWRATLAPALREAAAARTDADLARALAGLARVTRDGHTHARPDLLAQPCKVRTRLAFLGASLIVMEDGEGLQRGDQVLAVDGEAIEAISARWAEVVSASNEAAAQHRVAGRALTGPCGPARVEVERDGRLMAIKVRRARIGATPGSGRALQRQGDVVVVDTAAMRLPQLRRAMRRAKGAQRWVFDVRGYPRYMDYSLLLGHFVDEPTPWVRFSTRGLEHPGSFVLTAPQVAEPQRPHLAARVAILVDARTVSRGEYLAMALRAAPGAKVFGSTTAGADGDVRAVPLAADWTLRFTGRGVFGPDGEPTQQVGIVPDHVVAPTRQGVRAGRDEVLEAAIAWLREP